MHQGPKGIKSKPKQQKELAIRDNRMLCMFKISHLIGDIVKLKHVDHLTICGVLTTIKPSVPQKV
jgi:hypothetical protein